MSKTSGMRLNNNSTKLGRCYGKVKKSLKKMITRVTRRKLNRPEKE